MRDSHRRPGGLPSALHARSAGGVPARHRSRIGERDVSQRASSEIRRGAAGRPDSRRIDRARVSAIRTPDAERQSEQPAWPPRPIARWSRSYASASSQPRWTGCRRRHRRCRPVAPAARAAASQDAPSCLGGAGRCARSAGACGCRPRNDPRCDRRRSCRAGAATGRHDDRGGRRRRGAAQRIPGRRRSRSAARS